MPNNKKKNNAKQSKVVSRATVAKAPAASGTIILGAKQPKIQNLSDGSTVVSHTEFVSDVTADDLNRAGYIQRLNPQRATIFTWLSAIASRFEMFRFKTLKFHYKPSCSTQTNGYVVLGFDFDALDYGEVGPTKPEMLAWKYSSKSALWQPTTLDVSRDSNLSTFRYCDNSDRESGDPRLDALGTLVVFASSSTATFVGELFVTYTVEFRQPSFKLPPALYGTIDRVKFPSGESFNWWGATAEKFLERYKGNLDIKWVDQNTLRIWDAGKLLVSTILDGDSAVTNPPVSITNPAGFPSSDGNLSLFFNITDGTVGASNYVVDVIVPPIDLSWGISSGLNIYSSAAFATYKPV